MPARIDPVEHQAPLDVGETSPPQEEEPQVAEPGSEFASKPESGCDPASKPEAGDQRATVATPGRAHGSTAVPRSGAQAAAQQPMSPATAVSRGHLLKTFLHPRVTRNQLLAGLLCMLLGFSLIVQVQQRETDTLKNARDADLVTLIDSLNERSDRLEKQINTLRRTRDDLASSGNQRTAALKAAQGRADTLALLAGTVPATGPGVVLTVLDPKEALKISTFIDIVQELRDSGAEAIQVGDVRIVANTYFLANNSGGILVDDRLLRSPYIFQVIGDPKTIAPALNIPGGVIASVAAVGQGAQASVVEEPHVKVTAVKPSPLPSTSPPRD